jgi:hypothetical protein
MALGPTQPPIQWVPGALSLGVKWPGHEADHSPPASVKVKEWVGLYLHSPNTPPWRGAWLKKAQGQLYLYLYWIKGVPDYKKTKDWNWIHSKCWSSYQRKSLKPCKYLQNTFHSWHELPQWGGTKDPLMRKLKVLKKGQYFVCLLPLALSNFDYTYKIFCTYKRKAG